VRPALRVALAPRFAQRQSDLYRHYVTLLLKADGTNGSTSIIDSSPSPKTVTAFGNAQISTAQSKFGGASIAFDGSGDYASVSDTSNFRLGLLGEPFTFELWFYLNATGDYAFLSRGGGSPDWTDTTGYQYFAFIESGVLYWMWKKGVGNNLAFVSTNTLPAIGQWHHCAAVYDGTTTRLFINGSSVGTPSTEPYVTPSSANRVRIGAGPVDANLLSLNGYIDDLRITKGVARYTASFTPPTAAFPDF
jgi:hypothetical protein